MHLRVAVVSLLVAAHGAAADPATSCRDLAPQAYARLGAKARTKLPDERWARAKDWPLYTIMVRMDRAPHLVREILADCPGIAALGEPQATDARHLTTQVQLRAASFAALSRLVQLPAVTSIRVIDPTLRKRQMIEDPMFDLE